MQETLFPGLLLWRYVNLTLYGSIEDVFQSVVPRSSVNNADCQTSALWFFMELQYRVGAGALALVWSSCHPFTQCALVWV